MYQEIKRACDKAGITVIALESRLNFPRSSICKWDVHVPSISKVKAVADALGVTVDELIK